MTDTNQPQLNKKQILKATLWSVVIGGIVLIGAILPAEYGIDPIGAGRFFGFSKLYSSPDTVQVAVPMATVYPIIPLEKAGSGPDVSRPFEADNPAPAVQFAHRQDTVEVIVPAGKGIEFKINMLKYGKMKYEWHTADRTTLYLDFHGEVKQSVVAKNVYFESYTLAYSNNMVGTFLAPYEGKHGWYFRNSGEKDVVVVLRLQGQYEL
jgi:hypothetical protein